MLLFMIFVSGFAMKCFLGEFYTGHIYIYSLRTVGTVSNNRMQESYYSFDLDISKIGKSIGLEMHSEISIYKLHSGQVKQDRLFASKTGPLCIKALDISIMVK